MCNKIQSQTYMFFVNKPLKQILCKLAQKKKKNILE